MRDLPKGTVTLLFTDIEGSTYLLQQMGKRYATVLTECRRLLRAAFRAHHGHEVDTQGDAFFVAFARASDAILAAVAAQRALTAQRWPQGVVVRVRMGLHTGEPTLGAGGYVGLEVHQAARIMSAGHGGQVLLSQTTRDLVENDLPADLSLRDLGEHRLKDLQRPGRLYQLVIAGLPAGFPPLKTLDNRPNNLPVQLTPLIGREKEVSVIQHLLGREDVRLVTLTGPGGTGKTRLGLKVAAELSELFTDGVFFVNLAPISDTERVIATIAQALGLWEAGDRPFLEQLQVYLRERYLLLLLDNFEQVIAAAPQLANLLAFCPALNALVTSREALHLSGEYEYPVPPLAVPDLKRLPTNDHLAQVAAVSLFVERAKAIQPSFALTPANARAVAEICARLDGLPLTIELAAARIKLLPPQALLKRLEHRLEVLASGAQDLPARHQTLRNTLRWSYDLLNEQEQRLFRRFSVFIGGCTLEAAAAVFNAGTGQAMDILLEITSLLDKSLLQQIEWEGEEPRLLMLETIREYGLERLQACGQLEATREAHVAYYLRLAEEANLYLFSARAGKWFDLLERDYENLRTALEWTLEREDVESGSGIDTAVRLGSVLWRFWTVRGHMVEGRKMLERVLAASERSEAFIWLKAVIALDTLAWHQGDYALIEETAEGHLSLIQQLGDQQGIAHILLGLAGLAIQQRDFVKARTLAEEALAICREIGDTWRAAAALMILGRLASAQREHASAQHLLEECLALYRKLGYEGDIAWPLIYLARDAIAQGEHIRAHMLLEEAVTLCREAGNKLGLAHALSLLGQQALEQGDMVGAQALLTECHLLNQEVGNQRNVARSLFLLASVVALQGDAERAYAHFRESLAIATTLRHWELMASCLDGLAIVVTAQEKPAWAARLWGAAETLRQGHLISAPPMMRPFVERAQAAASTQLGEETFDAALAEGRMMTLEQVLATQEE